MKFISTFVLLSFPAICFANTSICKLEDNSSAIKAIAWDKNNGKAKITDSLDKQYEGVVTLSRKHDRGDKVNIYIKYDEPYDGNDAAEFIIFPVTSGYRVIGVSYIIKNGDKYLNTFGGNYTATCLSL